MPHAGLLCALLLPVEVRAFAANLLNDGRCARGLGVGEDRIMMRDQQQGSEQVFVNAHCGGTFSGAGFTLGVDMASAAQWAIGHHDVVAELVKHVDNIDECGDDYRTALDHVVESGRYDIVKALFEGDEAPDLE